MTSSRPPRALALLLPGALLAAVSALVLGAWPRLPARVDVQLLAFNDFHGNLDPPDGSSGRIGDTPAGGVEYLAAHLARLRAANPRTLVVAAGDNIGASPLLSALFHDEPSIDALNALGLDVSSVGNHEFDEGWRELYRVQHGGCHPRDGCQVGASFAGAAFQYLAANAVLDPRGVDAASLSQIGWPPGVTTPRPVLPAYAIRDVGGVRIGFIGMTLQDTARVVLPDGIRGLTFTPEAATANALVPVLQKQGVRAIVVLVHEGGSPARPAYDGCNDVTGPIVNIARDLSPAIDVVVSGHTHQAYVCTMSDKLVTSAASFGRLITDITLTVDTASDRVVSKTAHNVIVSRDVQKDAVQTAILARYRPYYAPLAFRQVGTATQTIDATRNDAGESALGDVIADAQLEAARLATREAVAAAFQNPGGLRADLVVSPGGVAGARPLTYETLFTVQPFGNRLVVQTMTGDAIRRALEQQFTVEPVTTLQVAGVTYAYDLRRPAGSRVDPKTIRIQGQPLDPTRPYRVVVNSFLGQGGDGLTVFTEGTNHADAGSDIDAIAGYLTRHSPIAPGRQDRIVRLDQAPAPRNK
jgi:5'-nucleotidase